MPLRGKKLGLLISVPPDHTNFNHGVRLAEAVRIAAGLAAWRKLTVTVCLREPAVLALSEFPEELTDGDNFSRYLPLVTESGGRICAQRNAPLLRVIGQAAVPYREIND